MLSLNNEIPTVEQSIAQLEQAGVEVKIQVPPPSLMHRKLLVIDGQEWLTPDAQPGKGASDEPLLGGFNRSSEYQDNAFFVSSSNLDRSGFARDWELAGAGHDILEKLRPDYLSSTPPSFDAAYLQAQLAGGPEVLNGGRNTASIYLPDNSHSLLPKELTEDTRLVERTYRRQSTC